MAANPLPCIVLFSRNEEVFHCFNINGTLLHSKKSGGAVLSPAVTRDSAFTSHIIYIDATSREVVFRRLPGLELVKAVGLSADCCVLAVSEDHRHGLLGHCEVRARNSPVCDFMYALSLASKKDGAREGLKTQVLEESKGHLEEEKFDKISITKEEVDNKKTNDGKEQSGNDPETVMRMAEKIVVNKEDTIN